VDIVPGFIHTYTGNMKSLIISPRNILILLIPPILLLTGFTVGLRYSDFRLKQFALGGGNTLPEKTDRMLADKLTGKCNEYGKSAKQDFLIPYKVKNGDTLLSIARDQLNDVSRVNQIIILNNDDHPSLSLERPFLEQGWFIYLPPPGITDFKDTLGQYKGEITLKPTPGERITWNMEMPTGLVPFVPKATDYDKYEKGDCIVLLMEKWNQTPLQLSHQ
jgi:hypothetical protein